LATKQRPLWRCPKCGERFVTANIWHACGNFALKDLFARSDPGVLKLFRRFARMVRACGPVRMIPQKSRVVFQVRVRFAGCQPRKSHLICSIALPQKVPNPRFIKITSYGARFIGHQFRIHHEGELDAEVQSWLQEAYRVGAQKPTNN
jgi:Domain of unknown function (DUF5655)